MPAITWIIITIICVSSLIELCVYQNQTAYVKKNSLSSPSKSLEKILLRENQNTKKHTITYMQCRQIKTIISSTLLIILCIQGFSLLGSIVSDQHPILQALFIISTYFITSQLIYIPFQYYIEKQLRFNKKIAYGIIMKFIQSITMRSLSFIPILIIILYIIELKIEYLWFFAWILLTLISLIQMCLYPYWGTSFFNIKHSLNNPFLEEKIRLLLLSQGLIINKIYIVDGSKCSMHVNAYFSGFGKNKDFIIYDTLLEKLTHEEILAILAHEIGHHIRLHVWKKFMLFTMYTGVIFFITHSLLKNTEWKIYFDLQHFSSSSIFIVIVMLFDPILYPLSPFLKYLFHAQEYEADTYSHQLMGNSKDLCSALILLRTKDNRLPMPSPLFSIFHYMDPSLIQRFKNLYNLDKKGSLNYKK